MPLRDAKIENLLEILILVRLQKLDTHL